MLYYIINKREQDFPRWKEIKIMEHFELVEKLVNTFGVSYEEAKKALEVSGWDPVEAAVILERAKNGNPIPEEPQPEVNTGRRGSTVNSQNNWKEEGTKFFNSIWNFLSLNEFVIRKSSGEVFMNIPIWIAVLLVCAFFWPVAIILAIVFIMGYRFSFTGPQMNWEQKKGPRGTVETPVEDTVEQVKTSCGQETAKQPETPKEETQESEAGSGSEPTDPTE